MIADSHNPIPPGEKKSSPPKISSRPANHDDSMQIEPPKHAAFQTICLF
jgi:hypothetical protein